jgi:hypothetical protein
MHRKIAGSADHHHDHDKDESTDQTAKKNGPA